MDLYLKIVALALITVILTLALSKQNKDIALLLSICACVLAAVAGISFIIPVLDFFDRIAQLIALNDEMLHVLLKATGVGILGELAAMICSDGGNNSLGKVISLCSVMLILWISLPLYESLLDLIQRMMEGL